MESRWPDHTPEEDEPPPWRGWAMAIGAVVALAFLLPRDANWFGTWQAPNFSMPEINLPEITVPDLDLRGRSENSRPEPQSPATAAIAENIAAFDEAPSENGDPMVRQVPFEACIGTITQTASALGPAALIEDTPERRVVRFKMIEGALTITCSRADGTMTIAQTLERTPQ